MAGRTDEELLKILMSPLDDYQPVALLAAKKEFEKRGLTVPKIEIIQKEILAEQTIITAKAEAFGYDLESTVISSARYNTAYSFQIIWS